MHRFVDDSFPVGVSQGGGDQRHTRAPGDEAEDGLHEPDVSLYRVRSKARLAACLHHLAVQAGHLVAGGKDERLVREGLQLDPRLRGERTWLSQGENQRLARDALDVERGILEREVQEPSVDLPGAQMLYYPIRPHLAQEELDLPKATPERTQDRRERLVVGLGHEAQGQPADLSPCPTRRTARAA